MNPLIERAAALHRGRSGSGRRRGVVFLLALLLASASLTAQVGNPFNERDDKYRLLGLKRAKAHFDHAKTDHERLKQLHAQKLIPRSELERSRSAMADAEVNYYQSLLAVVFEGQYVAIVKAIKYQSEDGNKHVRVTLENTSGGGAEYQKLLDIEDQLFQSLKPDVIHDVYVSLMNDEQAIISSPYEAKLEELRYGQPREVDFLLLRDMDEVIVGISYGNGGRRSPKISLQKDASVNKVILQSQQFSQEAELGGSVSFDLTLELFSGENDTFKLEVVNLPRHLSHAFVDPSSGARLSQFRFVEGNNTRRVALEVQLPERAGDIIAIDEPIPFYALVIPRDQAEQLGSTRDRQWTPDQVEALDVGAVRLELLPRGIGELLVQAPQLYFSALPGESVEMRLDLKNEGSQRLDNVEVTVDTPLNWDKSVSPQVIPSLEVGQEKPLIVTVFPAAEAAVGKYEIRVQSTSVSANQPVDGEDKTFTVELQAETDLLGIGAVVGAIVLLVLGIVIFGIRLSRR